MSYSFLFDIFVSGMTSFYSKIKTSTLLSGFVILISVSYVVFGITTSSPELFIMALLILLISHLVIYLIFGIVENILNYKNRRWLKEMQEKYNSLFTTLKLKSMSNNYPLFIGEDIREYATIHKFKSLVPLKQWIDKTDLLETYLNENIIRIENDSNNKNTILMHIQRQKLPDYLPWNNQIPLEHNKLILGESVDGYVSLDLTKNAHAFISGETGSGKSTLLRIVIYQALLQGFDVKLIDFKRGVDYLEFDGLIDIVYDYEPIMKMLIELVDITNKRYDAFRNLKVANIGQYNKKSSKHFNRVVVVIDELAELIQSGDKATTKSIVGSLETLTRISRAAGVNLILGLQRPDSSVINGQIKSNVTYRVCGRYNDSTSSTIMLGNNSATMLPDIKGRFIVKNNDCTEFQAFFLDESKMNISGLPKKQQSMKNKRPATQEATERSLKASQESHEELEPVASKNEAQSMPEPPQEQSEQTTKNIDFNFDDMNT